MSGPDRLVEDLRALGRSVPVPPADHLESRVLAAVSRPHARRRTPHRVRIAVAVAAALAALLAAPPVRAQVAEWFGFGAVVVQRYDDAPTPPGPVSPPPVTGHDDLARLAAEVGFTLHVPERLGSPSAVTTSHDGRVVSLGWDGPVRLDQTSSLMYTFGKLSRSVQDVQVDGRPALWFGDAHEVVVLDRHGRVVEETRRPAGQTLVWNAGTTTLRLEGDLSLEEALAVAESLRPVE